jgi:hypothetical protein
MANNRIFLRCKDDGYGVMIAKFYPGAWYTNGDRHEKIDAFLDEHAHDHDDSMWGGYQYELEYEIPNEAVAESDVPSRTSTPSLDDYKKQLTEQLLELKRPIPYAGEVTESMRAAKEGWNQAIDQVLKIINTKEGE